MSSSEPSAPPSAEISVVAVELAAEQPVGLAAGLRPDTRGSAPRSSVSCGWTAATGSPRACGRLGQARLFEGHGRGQRRDFEVDVENARRRSLVA